MASLVRLLQMADTKLLINYAKGIWTWFTWLVIKVPTLASLEDPEFLERFSREIRSMVMLTHLHVVPIINTGKVGEIPLRSDALSLWRKPT